MFNPELLIPLMGVIWPMIALIVFVYLHYTTRLKIRLALIESGRDASIFKSRTPKKVDRLKSLKNGIVALMAGSGIAVGSFITAVTGSDEGLTVISCLLISIGLGLISFYAYAAKQPIPEEAPELL